MNDMPINNNIKRLRLQRGLTQMQLAARLGYSSNDRYLIGKTGE
jgi:transcriptional regulator with XRE-family HTH domain